MPPITIDIQKAFFDLRKVQNEVDRAKQRVLLKSAAAVRRRQRSSIKFRSDPKKTSAPGSPPFAHRKGRYSPKYILFGYDAATESAAIGMVSLPQSSIIGATPFTEAMEKGGRLKIKKGRRRYSVKIRKRPSAVPALITATQAGEVVAPWQGAL